MSALIGNPLLLTSAPAAGDDAYQIERSVRFNPADDPYLERGQISYDGNRRIHTYAFWFKGCNVSSSQYLFNTSTSGTPSFVRITTSPHEERIQVVDDVGGWGRIVETRLRDPAAWTHICVSVNTTLPGTSVHEDRVKIYYNGKLITTSRGTSNVPNLNIEGRFNQSNEYMYIGAKNATDNTYDGYLADFHSIDGLALSPAAFGEFDASGCWQPKAFSLPKPNTGVTWSSYYSGSPWSGYPFTMAFDGRIDTGTEAASNSTNTWTPASPIVAKSAIRVYAYCKTDDSSTNFDFKINGQSILREFVAKVGAATAGWFTLPSRTLTSLQTGNDSGGSTWMRLYAIEVDGVILQDGQTDPTDYNNLNDGTTWSSSVSGSAYSGYPVTNLFDGKIDTLSVAADGNTHSFVPSNTITAKNRIRVLINYENGSGSTYTFSVNGTNYRSNMESAVAAQTTIWYTLPVTTIDTTNGLQYGRVGSNNSCQLYAIEVDGHLLVDSTVNHSFHLKFNDVAALKNVGYSQVLNSPTGALPIYGPGADDTNKSNLVLALPGFDHNDHHHTIKGSGSAKTVTNNGSTADTNKSKFYGKAMKFDGSNDYLYFPTSEISDFGSGSSGSTANDFCIEMWLNAQSVSGNRGIIGGRGQGTNGAYFCLIGASMRFNWGSSDPGLDYTIEADRWYHVAITRNEDKCRMFVNGKLVETITSTDQIDFKGNGGNWYLGYTNYGSGTSLVYFEGAIQDFRIYDGIAKYTTDFIIPVRNDWDVNNLVVADGTNPQNIDLMVDTPTNYGEDTGAGGEVRGNYPTFNPLYVTSQWAFSEGNLKVVSSGSYGCIKPTMGMTSGKWYCEMTAEVTNNTNSVAVVRWDHSDTYIGNSTEGICYLGDNGKTRVGDGSMADYGASWGDGDVIGIALDLTGSNTALTFYKNGTSQGVVPTTYTTSNGPWFFAASDDSNTGNTTQSWNFGQRAFKHAAPTGYKALCTQNLPNLFDSETSENNPSAYFDITTYTGDGKASRDIKGVGFQPDLVWIKSRDASYDHAAFDAARGANERIRPSNTTAEGTDTQTLTAFNSDGFRTGTDEVTNKDADKYVAWLFDAGTAAATASTEGSITPTAQWVNATAGFSITKWTATNANATIGHGLGAPPEFILLKNLESSTDWGVYHVSIGNTKRLKLNTGDSESTHTTFWQDTSPTNTVFSVGTSGDFNGTIDDMIAYCWTPIEGYSAFGQYSGNASTDGRFNYCGFKPRWVIIKGSTYGSNWNMFDTARDPLNINAQTLRANSNGAEFDGNNQGAYSFGIDILSNGFKIKNVGSDLNSSGNTLVYAAFAEHPFKTARANF